MNDKDLMDYLYIEQTVFDKFISVEVCGGFEDEDINKTANRMIRYLMKRYKHIGTGRNRIVFDMGNGWVLKFPMSYYGNSDNYRECNIKDCSDIQYPRTKRLVLDNYYCCLMPKLKTDIPVSELPAWASFVDCHQVGQNEKGEFLAYDFA